MPVSAWIMLIFGCVVLYGGFLWSLKIALRAKKKSLNNMEGHMEEEVQSQLIATDNVPGAVTSMVLGIVGLVVSFFPIAGLVLGILALNYSKKARKLLAAQSSLKGSGFITTGLVTGILAVIFCGLLTLFWIIAFAFGFLSAIA